MTRVLIVPGADDTVIAGQLARLPARDGLVVMPAPDRLAGLADAFEQAGRDRDAIAVVSSDLIAADEVLLRVLDDPGLRIAALVGDTSAERRIATQGVAVLSAGTTRHVVPDADAGFLGVLFVAAAVAGEAARAVRAADQCDSELLDVTVAALARDAALPAMTAVRPEPFAAQLATSPQAIDAARRQVALDTDGLRAARMAARPGDGFYSTFVLRRISRRLTPWAVSHAVSANTVTVVSAVVGLAGGVCFAIGSYPSLVVGALLLQASIVLDCVDGEIARATRTRSAIGAWLDSVTDRLKEYGALAGLALAGHHLWALALAAMIVQTVRHVQNFSFDEGALAAWRASMRDTRPLTDTTPWQRPAGATVGPASLTGSPGLWARRVLRMPIAERWLILSLAALADRPWLGLAVYLAATGAAEIWALLGALRRTRGAVARYTPELRATLAAYRDDGPLRLPAPAGVLGWLLPPLTALVEGSLVLAVTYALAPSWLAAAFGWFAAVAWHRYDLVYRRTAARTRATEMMGRLGGGWLIRSAVLGAAAALDILPATLVLGTAWLLVISVPESVLAGIRLRTPAASEAGE